MARNALAYYDLDVEREPEANPALTTQHNLAFEHFVPIRKALPPSDAYTFALGTSIVTGNISPVTNLEGPQDVDITYYATGLHNLAVEFPTAFPNLEAVVYSGKVMDNVFLMSEIENSMILTSVVGRGVTVTRVQKPTAEARRQLDALSDLGAGWNDKSPVPNKTSIAAAAKILDVLDEIPLSPKRVVPDAEGGVSIYFFGGKTLPGGARQQYASISSSNDGEIVALVHDRDHEPEAWDVGSGRKALREAAERIRRFIAA